MVKLLKILDFYKRLRFKLLIIYLIVFLNRYYDFMIKCLIVGNIEVYYGKGI